MRALPNSRTAWLLLGAAWISGCDRPTDRGQAILAAFDEISTSNLWPGFAPDSIPVAVYDGRTTYLRGHPEPPEGFSPVSDQSELWSYAGQYELVRASTSEEIGGVLTATLLGNRDLARPPAAWAATLVHEAFHVYQREKHPDWGANEVELFVYPVEDVDVLWLRRLETEALRRALGASDMESRDCWALSAVKLREARFASMPDGSVAYERGSELSEGLARYIEIQASPDSESLLPVDRTYAADEVRYRAYAVGAAFATLLDALMPEWKQTLERGGISSLDALLRKAVAQHGDPSCEFSADERAAARSRAAADVEALRNELRALRNEFISAPGPQLVIEAGDDALLWPERFDPSQLKRLTATEILHTRWLKIGNSGASLEVLDRAALTEGVGPHPLFNGIRRLTLTGLDGEPVVHESEGTVLIETSGFAGEFRGARVKRVADAVVVQLGAER